MRALVLCGDVWHPTGTVRAGLDPLEAAGFSFDWVEHANAWTAERMAAYPLVILAKSNNRSQVDEAPWATDEVVSAFALGVRSGQGLLVVHSGTAGYQDLPGLRGLMGGAFANHPPQCPVTATPHAGHPLCAGSEPFTLADEHYVMALDDPQADVFLTTSSVHGQQPGGWCRREGAGRVGVLTPGHTVEVWLHTAYQALLLNALRWCLNLPAVESESR